MARRQRLSEAQIAELFEPPTNQRDLVRHFTLTEADLAAVRRCRGDHNRLGYALMLCFLRYPGCPLRASERPPAPLLAFVAGQLDVLPECFDDYLAAERTRQRHAVECQEDLRLRPFGRRAAAELMSGLLEPAIENDQLAALAALVMQACRERRIVAPSPEALERLCADIRHAARREAYRRLIGSLSIEQRRALDALTQLRQDGNLSWLAWLRQMPEAAKLPAMLGLIERLDHVRKIGITPERGHLLHQARLGQLTREASRTTVQHLAGYERQRRQATLVAITLDITASLTDQAIELFDRLVGAMFRKAEGRQEGDLRSDARAINEKVRLYARVGAALIAAHDGEQDAFEALAKVIPWERFRASVAEAAALARPEDLDVHGTLGEHYAAIRRWSPAFLGAFTFESIPAAAPLLRAIALLREVDRTGVGLPDSAPTSFVRQRWVPHVLPGGAIDRRYYELCVLSELRDRLRAGDVWVVGSRHYRSFEERLVSAEVVRELQQAGRLPIAVDADFERFIAGRRTQLDARLKEVDASAAAGSLPEVTVTKGVLKIARGSRVTPPEAAALAARLYAMLPRIRVTDLLAEVAGWTGFLDCFTHIRSGETAADRRVLMAGLLADGLNLGLTRMAEVCSIANLGQLAWTADWHIRDETYALALRRLVDQQQREPFAAIFGSGVASSSDGQFFQAAGPGRDAGRLNAHYGQQPGFKVYTHLSDRYAPFHSKLIAATASEALHVLDALVGHGSEVTTRRHHTDGGGDADLVFALCALSWVRGHWAHALDLA